MFIMAVEILSHYLDSIAGLGVRFVEIVAHFINFLIFFLIPKNVD